MARKSARSAFAARCANGTAIYPSSMAEVQVQKSDVPYDTAHPLYKFGYGLAY